MFVSNLKKVLGLTASTVFISLVGATTAFADESADAEWNIIPGNIPVTVTITNIDPAPEGADPVYVSIQTEGEYQSLKGAGGITPHAKTGSMTATFLVSEPSDYAVSVWHDRDGDARFSMSEDYKQIFDSYGSSGQPPADRVPKFEEVKVSVPNHGTSLTVEMINPE